MRILFLPDWVTVLSFIIVWPMIQVSCAMLANLISDDKFNENSRFFRSHKWEKEGRVYERVFKIRLWKRFLPDGAKTFKKGFTKKKLKTLDEKYLEGFIKETCRAELGHWMQIPPFIIFGLWSPSFVVWIMLFYALAANAPCIIAQRYNRPRIIKLLNAVKEKNQNS